MWSTVLDDRQAVCAATFRLETEGLDEPSRARRERARLVEMFETDVIHPIEDFRIPSGSGGGVLRPGHFPRARGRRRQDDGEARFTMVVKPQSLHQD
jgi:hypothetical protein